MFHLRSNTQIRELIGQRIRDQRKARRLSQAMLASTAGLSRPTLSNLERGKNVDLDSLLSTLRALDLLEGLQLAIPEPASSPIDEIDGRDQRRVPAALAPLDTFDPGPVANGWVWGDQR